MVQSIRTRRSARSSQLRMAGRCMLSCMLAAACSFNHPAAGEGIITSSMLADWHDLPNMQGTSFRSFSSSDPGTTHVAGIDDGNKDFNNFLAVCGERPPVRDQQLQLLKAVACEPALEGYLLASDDGAGVLSRIFFPLMSDSPSGFEAERLRIFIDDLNTPAIDVALAAPDLPLFDRTSGAVVLHTPLVYQTHLRVLLDGLRTGGVYYYQVDVQHGRSTATVPLDQSTADFEWLQTYVHHPADLSQTQRVLDAGAQLLVLDEAGAGTVRQLLFTIAAADHAALADLSLRMYWDGTAEPAVDESLAMLFACHAQPQGYVTLPLSMRVSDAGVTLEWSWPMPFFRSARIVLVNRGQRAQHITTGVSVERAAPAAAAGYFHALTSRTTAPYADDARFTVAHLQGPGKYVGTLMHMEGTVDHESRNAQPLAFLEGDERFVVDGRTLAQGTGTEDYFDGGWYFRSGPFSNAFAAAIQKDEDPARGSAAVTAARWHLLRNAIELRDALDMSFEYGANRPHSATRYESVSFYYTKAGS